MLSNQQATPVQTGRLNDQYVSPKTSLYRILEFVRDQLPGWRDDEEREQETAEDFLTSQLCSYLQEAARLSGGFDYLNFKMEVPDRDARQRRIDLAVHPLRRMEIEGRHHTKYDTLIPIECKRLPTPANRQREAEEYVFTRNSQTGGIQRFKIGAHGARHDLCGMIAYVQAGTTEDWLTRVNEWIARLVAEARQGWSSNDTLNLEGMDPSGQVTDLRSIHDREGGAPPVVLRHFWIDMR